MCNGLFKGGISIYQVKEKKTHTPYTENLDGEKYGGPMILRDYFCFRLKYRPTLIEGQRITLLPN